MDSIIHADIFFFISSIAVVILCILLIVVIYYLRETLSNFRDMSRILKRGVDHATHHAEKVMDSMDINFISKLFSKITKTNKGKSKKSD